MKIRITGLLIILLAAVCTLFAKSYLALARPDVLIVDAINLAEKYVVENIIDGKQYYIQEASYGYHESGDVRFWLISFAKPSAGHYFVAVHMNKSVVGGMQKNPMTGKGWVKPNDNNNSRTPKSQDAIEPRR